MSPEELQFVIKMRDEANAVLARLGGTFSETGGKAKGLSTEAQKAAGSLDSIVKSAKDATVAIAGVAASAGLMKSAAGAWGNYEMGIVNVVKTTNMAGRELDTFRDKFDDLDQAMNGVSTQSIQELAAVVGQFGERGADNIMEMTEVLTKLGTTTDIVGAQGAASVSRILGLTGEGAKGVKQFGDALNYLGNNGKATESEILAMATVLAQSTAEFSMSSKYVLALSSGARDLGVNFELFGSVSGRVLRSLRDGLLSNNTGFQTFLKQTGKTRDEFEKLMKEQPQEVLVEFAKAYADLSKQGKATPLLANLGLNTDEVKRVFGAIGVNIDQFASKLRLVESPEVTGALDRETEAFLKAQNNQVEGMAKAWTSLKAVIGEALAPLTGALVSTVTSALYGIRDVIQSLPPGLKTVVAVALTLGPAIMAAVPAARLLLGALKLLGGAQILSGLLGSLSGLTGILSAVRQAFISTVAGAVMLGRTSAIMTATTGQAITGLISIIKGIGPAMKAGLAASLLFGKQSVSAVAGLGRAIVAASVSLLGFVRGFSLIGTVTAVVASATRAFVLLRVAILAIPALIASIPAAIASVVAAIAAAPAILVAAVAAAAVTIGVILYKKWDDILGYFKEKWDAFMAWFSGEDLPAKNVDLDVSKGSLDAAGEQARAAIQQKLDAKPVSIPLSSDSFEVLKSLDPLLGAERDLQQFQNAVNDAESAIKRMKETGAKSVTVTDDKGEFDITQEMVDRANRMLELRRRMAAEPLMNQKRGLSDQIEDANALNGYDKQRLENERQIRDAVEATGMSYEQVKKQLEGLQEISASAKQGAAFRDLVDGYQDQAEAAGAVTAEEKAQVEIQKVIRDFNKENLALTEAQTAEIRRQVEALAETKRNAAFNESMRSTQQELEMAKATTQAEKNRLAIKQQIADFERTNGTLTSAQRSAMESALAAKQQAEAFNQLRGTVDPVGEATRQYEQNVQTLNQALAEGTISAQQYGEMLNRLKVTTQDARDPFGAQLRSIEEAKEATRITGDYREADVKTLQTILSLQRQGVVVTQQQRAQLTQANRELQDMEKAQSSGLQGWVNSVGSMKDNLMDMTKDVASGLSDAISGSLTGAQGSWTNFLRSVAQTMVKIGVNQTLKQLIEGPAKAMSGQGASSGGFGGFFSQMFGMGGKSDSASTSSGAAGAATTAIQQMVTASMTVNAATVILNGSALSTSGAGGLPSPANTNMPSVASNDNWEKQVQEVLARHKPKELDTSSWMPKGSIDDTMKAVPKTAGLDLRGSIDYAQNTIKNSVPAAVESAATNFSKQISLSPKEILDLKKTLSTEWVTSAGEMQGKGIIDTILNRKASGKWGASVGDVVNARGQFSDINSVLTDKKGRWTVDALPDSVLNTKKGQMSSDLVDKWLAERAGGAASSVGDNLNYANPYFSDKKNLKWINELDGPVYGSGNAVHRHGTTPELQRYRPGDFGLDLPGGTGLDQMTAPGGQIPQVQQVAQQWQQQMTTANQTLAQAMPQQFAPQFQQMGQQFSQVFAPTAPALQGVAPALQGIGQQAQNVVPNLGSFGSSLTSLMGPLTQAPAATGQFGNALSGLLQQLAGGVGGGGGGGGGLFSIFGSILGGLFHKGGEVGAGTPASGMRALPVSTWIGAPRFHDGLKTDEYAAVLKRGERVLTANDNSRNMQVLDGLTAKLEAQQRQANQSNRSRLSGSSYNQNITVYAQDANSFRKSEGQLMADSSVQMRRMGSRNS